MNIVKERKVLLLIPSLQNYQDDIVKMQSLSKLRNELNLIVNYVSETISKLIYKEFSNLDKFSTKYGIPKISLNIVECANDNYHSGVRICLTKFNDISFLDNFKICKKDYEAFDISHIIELEIDENLELPKWKTSNIKDTNGKNAFDAKVITNISTLYNIILSFMIDMYSYYIVGLFGDFNFRSNFSKYKLLYLNSEMSPEIKRTYALASTAKTFPKQMSYIPISLRYNLSANELKLNETVKDYYKIIFSYIVTQNQCYISEGRLEECKSLYDQTEKQPIEKAFERFSTVNIHDRFSYFAVYSPPLAALGIDNDPQKKEKLLNDIKSFLIQNQISLYSYNDIHYFYVETLPVDIYPLFSYFKWFTMASDIDESEEYINE